MCLCVVAARRRSRRTRPGADGRERDEWECVGPRTARRRLSQPQCPESARGGESVNVKPVMAVGAPGDILPFSGLLVLRLASSLGLAVPRIVRRSASLFVASSLRRPGFLAISVRLTHGYDGSLAINPKFAFRGRGDRRFPAFSAFGFSAGGAPDRAAAAAPPAPGPRALTLLRITGIIMGPPSQLSPTSLSAPVVTVAVATASCGSSTIAAVASVPPAALETSLKSTEPTA